MDRILIIYYHDIVEDGNGDSYQMLDISKFEHQMDYLNKAGYQTLLFSDLDKPIPERSLIISFDDGYRGVYEKAWPIMKRYGFKGNVYLPTKLIGLSDAHMTWGNVEQLWQTGDWYFAAHTHSHTDIRFLSADRFSKELRLSDEAFLQHLGYRPEVFCIPFGMYDNASIKLLRELGRYRLVLGSYYGFASIRKAERTVLPRIGISNDDSIDVFADKLSGRKNWKGPLQRARLTCQNVLKRPVI